MKVFFRRIHLYLSLAAGLVILTACLTGAILVFEKELQMGFHKQRYYVAPGTAKLPVSQLLANATEAVPGSRPASIKIYNAPDRSVEINSSAAEKKRAANETKATARPSPKRLQPARQPGFTIFINPYTGAVLEKWNYQETFFFQVFSLHRWLLGGPDSIGKYIVGSATAIFLFIILTGLFLWWPKTRRILLQRLRIKTGAGWKRFNHDLHIVLGFYSAIFLFVFAFTGLAWSFEWFNKGIYSVTASPLQPPPPPKSVAFDGAKQRSCDTVFTIARNAYPDAISYNIALPKTSADAVVVSVLPQTAPHEGATDALYIDQYSGAVIGALPFSKRSLGARVRSTFKPVHTGSLWGVPSKIVAFVVCLFGVSFPVTGVVMWLNRTRKKKRLQAGVTV